MESYDQNHLLWSIVKILRGDEVVGTGFVVSDRLVATCAHVVDAAHAQPGDSLPIQFLKGETTSRSAYVVPDFWRDANKEDVAILKLTEPLPKGVTPITLGDSLNLSQVCESKELRGYGFPEGEQDDGLWADIAVVGQLPGSERLQLKSQEIEPGFSGGPVLDPKNGIVVGMIHAIREADPETGRNRDTAFANPATILRSILPEIPPSKVAGETSIELALVRRKLDLVEALGKCLALETPEGRDDCISLLPETIRDVVKRRSDKKGALLNIVLACLNYTEGIDSLVEAVHELEGESPSMKRVRKYAEAFVGERMPDECF